jgi:hypothetical protein
MHVFLAQRCTKSSFCFAGVELNAGNSNSLAGAGPGPGCSCSFPHLAAQQEPAL